MVGDFRRYVICVVTDALFLFDFDFEIPGNSVRLEDMLAAVRKGRRLKIAVPDHGIRRTGSRFVIGSAVRIGYPEDRRQAVAVNLGIAFSEKLRFDRIGIADLLFGLILFNGRRIFVGRNFRPRATRVEIL